MDKDKMLCLEFKDIDGEGVAAVFTAIDETRSKPKYEILAIEVGLTHDQAFERLCQGWDAETVGYLTRMYLMYSQSKCSVN